MALGRKLMWHLPEIDVALGRKLMWHLAGEVAFSKKLPIFEGTLEFSHEAVSGAFAAYH